MTSLDGHSTGTDRRAEAERLVAEAFAAVLVLPIEEVDRDSDFFEIGGDSVLAGRVITRLQPGFGTRVRMRDLFIDTTPARLAARALDRGALDS